MSEIHPYRSNKFVRLAEKITKMLFRKQVCFLSLNKIILFSTQITDYQT